MGKHIILNVAGNNTGNGTNVEINKYTGGDIIKTKITNNNSAVEIADAGKGSGDNVQQWSLNNYPNQDWIFEPATMSLKLR